MIAVAGQVAFDVYCVRISAYKPSLLSMCAGMNVCVICLCMCALGAVLALSVSENKFRHTLLCCHAYHHLNIQSKHLTKL